MRGWDARSQGKESVTKCLVFKSGRRSQLEVDGDGNVDVDMGVNVLVDGDTRARGK